MNPSVRVPRLAMAFTARVRRALSERCGVRPGASLIVAVSGGADSIALLRALVALVRPLQLQVVAVHVHHGLRGRAADADLRWVEKTCRTLGVGFLAVRCAVMARARRERISVEMAARAERYETLAAVAKTLGASGVAVAHTANDQAETVLLQILRKPGPGALAAMRYQSRRGGMTLLRPLLGISRAEIETALGAWGQSWREDATNRNPAFLRNRVRHELLPWLEKRFNPSLKSALADAADRCAEEEEILEALAARALKAAVRKDGSLQTTVLHKKPPAIRRRAIRQWLDTNVHADPAVAGRITAELLERLAAMTAPRTVGTVGAGRDLRIVREGAVLRIGRGVACKPVSPVTLSAGSSSLPDYGILLTVRRTRGYRKIREPGAGRYPAEAWVSASKVGKRALVIRGWRPGDRIAPLGMTGTRKLQDVFTDGKIPSARRRYVPVVECDGEIVWVPGYRIARTWAVPARSATSLHLQVTRLKSTR